MKSKLFIAFCLTVALFSCRKDSASVSSASSASPSSSASKSALRIATGAQSATEISSFIPVDSANAMIMSYLASVNYTSNDSTLRGFIVDADSLRAYLADTNVKNIKLIFAHSDAYLHSGNKGVYSGMEAGGMTIVIAGFGKDGEYVYHNGKVLDHATPCPYTCPSGAAGGYLLQ